MSLELIRLVGVWSGCWVVRVTHFDFIVRCSFSNRHLLLDLLTTERMKIASFQRSDSTAQSDGVAKSTVQIRY
jgi:hypothetical protein